jgi:hypothetical protein
MAASFDTLRGARRLKEAGAAGPVAEAIAEAIGNAREFDLAQLATKADLALLRGDLTALRSDLGATIAVGGHRADTAFRRAGLAGIRRHSRRARV